MIIAPKIAADSQDVPKLIAPYMNDAVEFHLTSFTQGETNWRAIVEKYGLKHVTLHAPFGTHNIEEVVLSTPLYDAALNYLLRQKQYAEELDITLCVLFHVSYALESIINLRVVEGINALMTSVGTSSSLLLLLENTVASLDRGPVGGYKEPLSYILRETNAAQVRMCFDLCHYQASKNVLLDEYTFPTNWRDRVYQVHFSDTLNNEGYRHIATTHGKAHESVWDVARDLCTLKSLGIDAANTILVTEMSEEDYSTRSLEARELGWLHQIDKQGLTF